MKSLFYIYAWRMIMNLIKCWVVSLVSILIIYGCNSSDNESNTDEAENAYLTEVTSFQIADTAALVSNLNESLSALDIDEFFEQSFLLLSQRNVEDGIRDGYFDGLSLDTVTLLNISDAYTIQTAEMQQAVLILLESYDYEALSANQKISYDVYYSYLSHGIESIQYLDYGYPATYGFFGWPGSTETFFTQAFTINNFEQAEFYLVLLNQLGRRFEQIEELLDSRAAAGIVEPSVTLSYSQQAVEALGNSNANDISYYTSFSEQLAQISDLSSEREQTLLSNALEIVNQKVIPAYQSLSSKMTSILSQSNSTIGVGQFQGGEEYYQFRLNYFTSSQMTAEQVHQLGIDELARIHSEMRTLFDQLGYPEDETIAQLFARVDSDGGTILASESEAFYEELIAEAYLELPSLFNLLPEQEVDVIGGTSGGYYIAGSDDGSRPGAFYANTSQNLPYTTMPTLAYHEAVPGHHLQIALANELDLPLFRRKINFTAYVEGWGLYAERLAKDAGWYNDDIYGDLGRLQFEAMRAARLVIDTGIHVFNWTYDEANQYHINNVGFSGAIARYSVWPGQATAYTVGMLKILELRSLAEQELGDLYDVREFHDAVVGNGSMPLNVLEQVAENFISNRLNQ